MTQEEIEKYENVIINFKIYTLKDPRDFSIKYVGRTKRTVEKRLKGHIIEALYKRGKSKKLNKRESWLIKLYDLNLYPIVEEIDNINCNIITSYEIEKNYILNYSKYHDLVNDDDHGIGLVFANNKSKIVYQYNLDGVFIKEWLNACVVYDTLGIKDVNIGLCCRNFNKGGRKTAGNYYWSYNKLDSFPIRDTIRITKKVYLLKNNILFMEFNSLREASNKLNIEYKKLSEICCSRKTINNITYSYNIDLNSEKENTKTKKVDCFSLNGEFILTFNTIKEAAVFCNLKTGSSITQVCKNRQKTAGGYIWKYNNNN